MIKEQQTEKQRIGKLGEDIACRYLEERRFKIFTRNYRKKWGELDIVAKDAIKTYFIEVKSVSCENINNVPSSGYRPEENVHPWKLKRLSRTIETFIAEESIEFWQFDVITVYIQERGKLAKVERLENVTL